MFSLPDFLGLIGTVTSLLDHDPIGCDAVWKLLRMHQDKSFICTGIFVLFVHFISKVCVTFYDHFPQTSITKEANKQKKS